MKPYCGIKNKPPSGRVRGTTDQCLKSGQVRYYGVLGVENIINKYLEDKKKSANEKKKEAKNKIKEAQEAVKKANNAVKEVQKVEKEVKKRGRPPGSKNKIKTKVSKT